MAKAAVRRINEWDGPAMLKIYTPYTGTIHAPERQPPKLADYVSRIDTYTYGLGWLMCEIDTNPVGFCHLTEDRHDPKNLFSVEFQLYVKPEFQRIGVGKALWTLMRDMMEMGSRRQVTARVVSGDKVSEDFFRAMGFVPGEQEQEERGKVTLWQYNLNPLNPQAERPIKPYLLEGVDYEKARERAAKLVKISSEGRNS